MYISQESPAETDQRLRRLAAMTSIEMYDGDWWYEEFPGEQFPARVRPDAIALVRDQNGWCQPVPVRPADHPGERFRIWSCHFPDGVDNSGFVGWLAARIKARTGSGVLVVCGPNDSRGGIYDYWGCPVEAAAAVLSEVAALRGSSTTLDGRRMRAVATASVGEVNADTLFAFAQEGSTVWARYAGGAVQLGYLVGTLRPGRLTFRYAQVDGLGEVHGGRSVCDVTVLADGRVRLLEHFHWESREGSGTNVLEEVAE
ncbi:MAG: DUF6196 family protein [Gemmatimonadales bacterium]